MIAAAALAAVSASGDSFGRELGDERVAHRRVARGQRAGDERAGLLLLGQHGLGRQARQVQLQVLGVVGQAVLQGFDAT